MRVYMNSLPKSKISSFQFLRGLACLLIIIEHVRFLPCGAWGVDIFFVLSGFMAMYTTENGTGKFLLKRVIRIAPFYWLMTFATFVGARLFEGAFVSTRAGVKELLYSLFFIPFDMNTGCAFLEVSEPIIQPLMRIGWTLNLEMLFYVLFFLASKISFKRRAVLSGAFLLILIPIGMCFGVPALSLWGNPIILEFIFGMALFYVAKAISNKEVSRKASAASGVGALVILLIVASIANFTYFDDYRRPLLWGIPMASVVLLSYIYDRNCKTPKAMVWLGDISFSVYLVHYYIVMVFDRYLFDFSNMSLKAWCGFALSVFTTIVISYLMYFIVEKKLTSFIRRKLVDKK